MSDDIRKKRKRQSRKGKQSDEPDSPRMVEDSPKPVKASKESKAKATKVKPNIIKEETTSSGWTRTILYILILGLVLSTSIAVYMGDISVPLDADSFSTLGADCVFPNHQNIQLHIDDVKKLVDDAAKQLPSAEQLKRFVEASFGVSQMVGTDNGESEEALNTLDVNEQLDISETEHNLNEKPNESMTKHSVGQTSSNKVSNSDSNKASVQDTAAGDL